MTAEPRVLVEKLNAVCRRALEQAAELCVKRTHYAVEAGHLLVRLLEDPRSDLRALLRHYDLSDAECVVEFNAWPGYSPACTKQPPGFNA